MIVIFTFFVTVDEICDCEKNDFGFVLVKFLSDLIYCVTNLIVVARDCLRQC